MKLVESSQTRNPCYTAGRKITVKGLMLHSVGCPQPKASAFINSWNSPTHDTSCVHGFIDGNDGTVYQTLPWNHRGWHCGNGNKGSGNNTHIGVEMCEPACIKYTAGSNFTCSNLTEAKAVAERTYKAAVELFAMLCKKYSLNPLADGVVISHREGHSQGIASNHGDPEHLWAQLGTGYTMDSFRRAVKAEMGGASFGTDGHTKIMGNAAAAAEQMKAYLKAKNPNVAQSVLDLVPLYLFEGKAEGVRGDIAFAQSCLETGNFTFSGSAVTLSQNNFCGMGVTSNGMKGNSFGTPQIGIRAQVAHLPPLLQKPKPGTASGSRGRTPTRRKGRSSRWRRQRSVRTKIRGIPCLMNPGKRCTPGRQRSSRIWCGYPSPTLTSEKAPALDTGRSGNIREPALSRLWRRQTVKAHPSGDC